jgi:hypothetical protein
MEADDAETILKDGANVELSACFGGVVDCLFALGVVMANSGLISRQDLARSFEMVAEQQARQGGDIASRSAVPRMLAALFRLPVSDGFQVIEGGKAAGDPPPAAG